MDPNQLHTLVYTNKKDNISNYNWKQHTIKIVPVWSQHWHAKIKFSLDSTAGSIYITHPKTKTLHRKLLSFGWMV